MLRRLVGANCNHARSFSASSTVPPQPWLFVGLGNPSQKFMGTRHNVGFEMVDAFADAIGISLNTLHCKALFGQGFVGNVPVFLAKPQTYMNLCGESIVKLGGMPRIFEQHLPPSHFLFKLLGSPDMTGPLAAYYKLPLNRVMVFHDDLELPCGVLRIQLKGGHGSHNGLKSVIDHFRGNREFARLRIGIGRPPGQMDRKAFVLQKFNSLARERIDAALEEGVSMLKLVPKEGLEECGRWFNREQKYKHIRVQGTHN